VSDFENYAALLDEISRQKTEIKKLSREARLNRSLLDKFTKNTAARDALNKALSTATTRQKSYTNMLLEYCPSIIVLLDELGQFVLSTDSLMEVMDIPNFDFIKNRNYKEVFAKYLPEAVLKDFDSAIKKVAFSNEAAVFDAWIDFHNSQPRYYSIEMRHTGRREESDSTPIASGILVVMVDITDFMREKHRAEAANNAKSAFLAHMSHEIRTPLTTVLGIAEIQLQTPDMPLYTKESLSRIYNSASTLLNIVNDILDFSKIESGRMDLLCDTYETAFLISYAAQLHLVHSGKNINFHLHVDETLPAFLWGDSLRIKQILSNILSNAFKYTEAGEVNLSVTNEENDTEDCTTLVVIVRDTGFGMTPEQLNSIYSDYTRFHEQVSRFIGGTGLGMSIVYRLIEMMNAEIKIESEVNIGTTVTMRIPQKVVSAEIIGQKTADKLQRLESILPTTEERAEFIPERMPYGKVLVVDDLESNLYVVKGLLAFYDLHVETCESGQEAINKVAQGKEYDIIFMDYMMPVLNGTETMLQLREKGYTAPIIALTANAIVGQAEEFIKKGFDDFISKPIQTKILNLILNQYIRDKQPSEVINAARETAPSIIGSIDDFMKQDEVATKIKTDFARDQKNALANINDAIADGDINTAHRLAHTLKGLAGLMNETALFYAAENVEHLLAEGEIQFDRMSTLEYELKRVLEEIGELEPTQLATNSEKPFDKENAISLLEKISPLLTNRSSACLDHISDLRQLPETAVLVRQMEDFDFPSALKTLTTLLAILKA